MRQTKRGWAAALVIPAVALSWVTLLPAPAQAAVACDVKYTVASQWSGGFQAGIVVQNVGSTVRKWELNFAFPNGQTIQTIWGGRATVDGADVTVTNESWNGSLPAASTVEIGFLGSWTGANDVPTTFAINGTECSGGSGASGGAVSTTEEPTAASTTSAPPQTTGPAATGGLYVDPTTQAARWVSANSGDSRATVIRDRIAEVAQAHWLASYSPTTVTSETSTYVDTAAAAGQIPQLVLYAIPNRDCGGASSANSAYAPDLTSYGTWVSNVAKGLGTGEVIVLLEPDSLALQTCLSSAEATARHNALAAAVTTITSANPKARVYLDAGHSRWNSAAVTADRLEAAGVAKADGFVSNVSNYNTTADEVSFGKDVLSALGNPANLHQVIDTSRNGAGPGTVTTNAWCDDPLPSTRRLGLVPTLSTGESTVDAFLWVKKPGELDGCGGAAGSFSPANAYSLAGGAGGASGGAVSTTPATTTSPATTRPTTTSPVQIPSTTTSSSGWFRFRWPFGLRPGSWFSRPTTTTRPATPPVAGSPTSTTPATTLTIGGSTPATTPPVTTRPSTTRPSSTRPVTTLTIGGSGGAAGHVDNPYAGATLYVNPEWSAKAGAEPGGSRVSDQPTAVWLDRTAAIEGTTTSSSNGSMGLRDHLDEALLQGATAIQFVIYNLPGRDCAALASNGELGPTEIDRYKSEYIDPIAAIEGDPQYADLRIINIIEIDSLPNLITNTGGRAGATSTCDTMKANGNYVTGVAYALGTLHALGSNIYNYVDAAHHGWIGWDDNSTASATLFAETATKATGGMATVDGFITNTANYSALTEPHLNVTDSVGGTSIRQAKWVDWNQYVDELTFAQAFREKLVAAGFDSDIGMLIDTSRNGWGGSDRPTDKSTATDLNTYVDESRIDRRIHAGNWCNQAGAGIGERPQADPAAGIDAYVWVKPPGESDGSSSLIANTEGKGFDQMCDPDYAGNARNGNSTSGALPGAPISGSWFSAQFQELMDNAYPPL